MIKKFCPSHLEKEVSADIFNAMDSTSTSHKYLANILSSTHTIKLVNGRSVPVKFTPTDSLRTVLYELETYEKEGLFLIPSFLKQAIPCVYFVRNKLQHENGIHKYSDVLTLPFVKENNWDAICGFPEDILEWSFIPDVLLDHWIEGDYKVVDTPTERPYLA